MMKWLGKNHSTLVALLVLGLLAWAVYTLFNRLGVEIELPVVHTYTLQQILDSLK